MARVEIRELGLRGVLHRGEGAGPRPGVLVLGGSAGGAPVETARLLAAEGISALALAYFGVAGAPPRLDCVPLETFDRGVELLAADRAVDPSRLGILGISKGGEAALLVASRRADIRAVVSFAGSGVVFQSPAFRLGVPTSSWSADGRELP